MNDDTDQVRARLVRLEEAQAFGERTSEQLAEEVRALGKRVAELQAVVRRLEGQVGRLASPPEQTESEQE